MLAYNLIYNFHWIIKFTTQCSLIFFPNCALCFIFDYWELESIGSRLDGQNWVHSAAPAVAAAAAINCSLLLRTQQCGCGIERSSTVCHLQSFRISASNAVFFYFIYSTHLSIKRSTKRKGLYYYAYVPFPLNITCTLHTNWYCFPFLFFTFLFRWIARGFRAYAIIWSISRSDFWRGIFCVRQLHVMHYYNLHFIQREKWKINRFVANAVGTYTTRCTRIIVSTLYGRKRCVASSAAHTLLPFVQVSMVMRAVRKM